MKGKLFIDGHDAFTEYGIFVEQNGYRQIIQYPAFKKLDTTEWPDDDGIEVDLESPQLDTRTLQIQFCIVNVRYAEDLFDELSNGSYHTFEFTELKRTWRLRMTQNGSFKSRIKLGKITVSFADDFPVVPSGEFYPLGKTDIRQIGYEVDGVDMSQFGAYVLDGSDESIRKAANVRDNLKISTKDMRGIIYDGSAVTFKSKDVTLKCLINCDGIDEFWRRYDALFAVLLDADERRFYYAALGNEYNCYYKSMSVSKFDILRNNHVWCEFSIVLTVIDYHPVGQYMLLAHEDFALVEVELSGNPTFIRIRPKRGISLLIHERGEFLTIDKANEITLFFND
nr:MAG TPA: hypothetical protein [Caudoviricetes sp.]